MIKLRGIRYVRLGTCDPEGADRFVRQVIGLLPAHREHGLRYYRSDRRDHTLVCFEGDPSQQTVGFDVDGPDAVDAAGSTLDQLRIPAQHGGALECEQRRVRAFICFRDPSGNEIELVAPPLEEGSAHPVPGAAGLTGFSHVGLCTTDAAATRNSGWACSARG